jgi:DNA-binding response OmpR family regulator
MEQRRVLVVDDEESIRCLMTNVFESAGYVVTSAGTGREAFEKLTPAPDLITVDLVMPDLTGWELIERICSRPDAPTVVVVSGRADADSHPLRGCVAGVVRKPFMPRELLDICETVLRGREKDRPAAAERVERRRVQRRDFVMDVRVAPNVGNPMLSGKVIDLSPLGAEVELPAQMTVGQRLRLALSFPGRPRPVLVDGRIQYCATRNGIWACGLEFANVSADLRLELANLLEIPAPGANN